MRADIHLSIPHDTEILLTHTPPYRILDKTRKGKHAGCKHLLAKLQELASCRLHVFGHIHEAFGAAFVPRTPVELDTDPDPANSDSLARSEVNNGYVAVNAALPKASCVVIVDLKN